MPIPNFFIIGAGSSGTTSLYHHLRQHPDVFMPTVKEPCYFAPELLQLPGLPPDAFVTSWSEYQRLFEDAQRAVAIGEASVAYLASEQAPALIAKRVPEARIVAILRNPAERLLGRYGAVRAAGIATGFRQWAEAEMEREASSIPPIGNVRMGRYATHLTRWFAHIPPERRLVLLFDELRDDPHGTMRRLFGFLGVNPDWPLDLRSRHNVTHHVRWPLLRRLPAGVQRGIRLVTPPALRRWFRSAPPPFQSPDERAWAMEFYAGEVAALERLLKRDLSAWR